MRGHWSRRTAGMLVASLLAGTAGFVPTAHAEADIRIGITLPLSGPASSYSAIGKAAIAYLDKINKDGGIAGRRLAVFSADDAYSPPKTIEAVRKLVESDDVLFLFNTFGTPTNIAILKYVAARKIPHLFVGSGAAAFGDAKANPWSMAFRPDYPSEGRVYGRYIVANKPDARIGVIYQNDDYGRDYLKGLKEGLGDKASLIVAEQSYDVLAPSVDSQIVNLKAAGVDTLMIFASNRSAAQTIRKVAEVSWKPTQFLASAASSVASVLTPAGLPAAQNVMTIAYLKDPKDPQWRNDEGVKRFLSFMDVYLPHEPRDLDAVQGYNSAQMLEAVLRQCNGDISRANVMRQAETMKDVRLDMLLPGITINTSPTDHRPYTRVQLMAFKGDSWTATGGILSGN